MVKKGCKLTEEHKKNIGIANSIALKGHKCSENQLKALERGRKLSDTKEAHIKRVKTRRERDNYKHTEEAKKKIKIALKRRFPNKRPINSGCWIKGQRAWNKDLKGYMMGEKNNMWQGGISFEPYGLEFNEELKEEIKKRDNHTCKLCEVRIVERRKIKNNPSKNWLVIHHIDYNKQNNVKNNLITLCNFCNISVNTKREQWTNLFQNKIKNG